MDERYLKEELQVGGDPGDPMDDLPPSDRIILAVISPGRAFDGLLRARNLNVVIGVAAIAAIVLSFATAVVMGSSEIFQEQQAARLERVVDEMRSMEGMSAEDIQEIERQFESQREGSMVGAFIGSAISIPVMLLIVGLLILPVAKIFEKGHQTYIGYRHTLAVAALSVIPMMTIALLLAILQLLTNFDTTSIGLHSLASKENVVLYVTLMAFTIPFILWVIVGGIGTARIARTSPVGPTLVYFGVALLIMGLYGYASSVFPMISPV